MMVLFVAMVVAIAIIQFSRSTIEESKKRLIEYGKDDSLDNKIVEIKGTAQEIVYLAEECKSKGEKGETDDYLCFVVKTASAPSSSAIRSAWDAENNPGDLSLGISSGQKTFYIRYEPVGNVMIES